MIYEYEDNLPVSIEINGKSFKIRNDCDYRIVLKCIKALNDKNLRLEQQIECCLIIFYENYHLIEKEDLESAIKQMYKVINYGDEDTDGENVRIMDWHHDFKNIAPPVNRILGYDVRIPDKYTHWWTFVGGYMEIGECTWRTFMAIREKRKKSKKLEDWELEIYRTHKKEIDLPQNLTDEEKEWLDSDW